MIDKYIKKIETKKEIVKHNEKLQTKDINNNKNLYFKNISLKISLLECNENKIDKIITILTK